MSKPLVARLNHNLIKKSLRQNVQRMTSFSFRNFAILPPPTRYQVLTTLDQPYGAPLSPVLSSTPRESLILHDPCHSVFVSCVSRTIITMNFIYGFCFYDGKKLSGTIASHKIALITIELLNVVCWQNNRIPTVLLTLCRKTYLDSVQWTQFNLKRNSPNAGGSWVPCTAKNTHWSPPHTLKMAIKFVRYHFGHEIFSLTKINP